MHWNVKVCTVVWSQQQDSVPSTGVHECYFIIDLEMPTCNTTQEIIKEGKGKKKNDSVQKGCVHSGMVEVRTWQAWNISSFSCELYYISSLWPLSDGADLRQEKKSILHHSRKLQDKKRHQEQNCNKSVHTLFITGLQNINIYFNTTHVL